MIYCKEPIGHPLTRWWVIQKRVEYQTFIEAHAHVPQIVRNNIITPIQTIGQALAED